MTSTLMITAQRRPLAAAWTGLSPRAGCGRDEPPVPGMPPPAAGPGPPGPAPALVLGGIPPPPGRVLVPGGILPPPGRVLIPGMPPAPAPGTPLVPGMLRGPLGCCGSVGGGGASGSAEAGVLALRGAGAALCTLEPRCAWAPLGRGSVTTGAGAPEIDIGPGTGVPGITDDGPATGSGAGVMACARGWISFASFVTFCVGASWLLPAASRAPHPPQKRESGSFWVPQLGQCIPTQG
ncbi:MAG TPA: hypothetical protein VNO30_08970 [Kofleriaceae bacterium]|nr:hypothetical protein [Kofleriaceae bacterium]